ncbi:class I SAM-dependent methyltransferase [Sphingosinicella sp. LHD-64]|uniref:class I SAM-dependent methyltransferase n=1 Tax=Sphingosinicella sp. LHD-64 TaxID=3072139 RepID=UPI00280D0A8A|nr:class I SAM-dependent methyltransferase [Sphingosinicella sp. LHD-64]MDQ8757230.1 class I SAM-dependent methyltransferase [Sphingosinicella sp. LHD-64]
MNSASLKTLDEHFEFGENWLDYSRRIDDEAILEAEKGLRKLIPAELIKSARFIDIGCGSGLHSLAALRLGAAEVVAIDIDPNSVQATQDLLSRQAPEAKTTTRLLSIFDADSADLGQFDIVYSWGVLHHTGAMWEAVERAARLVAPQGLFALALYERRPSCVFWFREKKLYMKAPEVVRKLLRGLYKAAFYAGLLMTGRNPVRYVQTYKSARGMNFYNDVHDWMGGYPYESASVDEVRDRMQAMGFEIAAVYPIKKGLRLLGTGCAEFTLIRASAAQPTH